MNKGDLIIIPSSIINETTISPIVYGTKYSLIIPIIAIDKTGNSMIFNIHLGHFLEIRFLDFGDIAYQASFYFCQYTLIIEYQ